LSSGVVALRLTGAALRFAFVIALARLLGAEGTGLYYLALSTVSLAVVASRLGLDNVLLRLTAAHAERGRWPELLGVHRSGIRLTVMASVVVSVVIAILAMPLSHHLFAKPALVAPLLLMSLAIVPVSLSVILGQFLRGLKRVFVATFVQAVTIPALSLAAVFWLVPRWQVRGAAAAYLLAAWVACAVGLVWWKRSTPSVPPAGTESWQLFVAAAPLFGVALAQSLMNLTGTTVLGIWRSSAEVGTFAVASRAAQYASFFLMAINTVVAPRFAALHVRGDVAALTRAARVAAGLTVALSLPLLGVFILTPDLPMRLFGPEFADAGPALRILAFGQLVNIGAGSVGMLLMMSGNERALMKIAVRASLLQLVATVTLVPPFGVEGAAVASAGGLIVLNVTAMRATRRHLGVAILPALPLGRRRR
jgi:O-antigen/teichoic acid export membrane protein